MAFNFKAELKENVESIRNAKKEEWEARKDEAALKRQYHATKTVKNYLSVDERHQTWAPLGSKDYKNTIFRYSDLVGAEVLQNNEQVTSGSLGSVVAGGLLTGGVGAILGGVVGPKTTKEVCSSLQIKLALKSMQRPVVYIDFISTTTKKSDPLYKKAVQRVDECMAILTNILEANGANVQSPINAEQASGTSAADELMKFKQLLDAGAITQEEYDTKKAQILGL